ncbi:hypothetical protein ACFLXV_02995 [Chloroflexota bacterium]
MAYISFVSTYRPIICGIADYSEFITRESPPGKWEVLSFKLENCKMPLRRGASLPAESVWFGIPGHEGLSAGHISDGLNAKKGQVVWFQHEFGIWKDTGAFVRTIRDLNLIKVISPHSLHFQSNETPYGLRRSEYSFLRAILQYLDGITVFSEGVCSAVSRAFPEHHKKVHILRHGAHVYPQIAGMNKMEAKARVHEYLMNVKELDEASKRRLIQQRVLLDPDTVVLGGTGFVTASKGMELLYQTRDILQQMLPRDRIAAMYVGFLREPDNDLDRKCAVGLRDVNSDDGKFFVETYLPNDILPVFMRALDICFYWPHDCTQSGIIAHALGAGATIACRDLEGVGETVRMAGGLTSPSLGQLIDGIKELVLNPAAREKLSMSAARYAEKYSWRNQAMQHFALAEQIRSSPGYPLVLQASRRADTGVNAEPSLAL